MRSRQLMMRSCGIIAIPFGVLLLASGCQRPGDPSCYVPALPAAADRPSPDTRLNRCIQRTAAELARGPDNADAVARGIVFICRQAVNASAYEAYVTEGGSVRPAQPDPTLRQQTRAETETYALGRAREEILRRRAARCSHQPWAL